MRVRIEVKDGMPETTRISTEDGRTLDHVAAVNIRLRPGELARADLEFIFPLADLIALPEVADKTREELRRCGFTVAGIELLNEALGALNSAMRAALVESGARTVDQWNAEVAPLFKRIADHIEGTPVHARTFRLHPSTVKTPKTPF